LLAPVLPERMRVISRIGYNLYNSGIASLTVAAMLAGVMEIAGTGSRWILWIRASGIMLLAAGIACQAVKLIRGRGLRP